MKKIIILLTIFPVLYCLGNNENRVVSKNQLPVVRVIEQTIGGNRNIVCDAGRQLTPELLCALLNEKATTPTMRRRNATTSSNNKQVVAARFEVQDKNGRWYPCGTLAILQKVALYKEKALHPFSSDLPPELSFEERREFNVMRKKFVRAFLDTLPADSY